MVKSTNIDVKAGYNNIDLNIEDLNPDLYTVRIIVGSMVYIDKLLKK